MITGELEWSAAQQEAAQEMAASGMDTSLEEVKQTTRRLGTDKQSAELAQDYLLWARSLETFNLRNCREPPRHRSMYEGRARVPSAQSVPLLRMPRLLGEVFDTLGGYGIVSRLWSSILSLVRKLGNAKESNKKESRSQYCGC